ncbi:MAG: cyclic nucleotide-binding domain-containing protein [Treponema sp.]|nr:cyclic nucleotide-binding domain-containing protein [Treponema sp.]
MFQPVILKLSKDSYIFVEVKPNADKFFIIKEGRVRVFRNTGDMVGNAAGPGDMFGVVSVMAGHGYIESAVAVTDVVLLVVERKQYGELISKASSVAIKNIKQFSIRLRELNDHLSHQMLKSTSVEDSSILSKLGEYYEKSGKINQAVYSYQQYLVNYPDAENNSEIKTKIDNLLPKATVDRPSYPVNVMMQTYPKDCLLFAEGEKGHNLYIIQSGSVKITKMVNNQEIVLAVLGKSDIFGEMAMLEDKPRAATAEIYEDCKLLAVNRENFSKLINEQPDMVVKLTGIMSERIWLLYRQLDNTFIENPLGRLYDALIIQLEKNRVDLKSNEPYQCSFGFNELQGMAGITIKKGSEDYVKFLSSKKISINNDKIFLNNVFEIFKEAEYYRSMQKKDNSIRDYKHARTT